MVMEVADNQKMRGKRIDFTISLPDQAICASRRLFHPRSDIMRTQAPSKAGLYTVQESVHHFRRSELAFSSTDVITLTQARAQLSELADQVKAGTEKIITKNGVSYVALIDAERLDYYHQLEREHLHLLTIEDARAGLADVAAGHVDDARTALNGLKRRRTAKTTR